MALKAFRKAVGGLGAWRLSWHLKINVHHSFTFRLCVAFARLWLVIPVCYNQRHWNRGGFYGLADLLSLGFICRASGACASGGLRGGPIGKAGRRSRAGSMGRARYRRAL